jgi:CMP/dCMP kinase
VTGNRLPSPIAIDGPAASGKSTLGRALADTLHYSFLDTGLMYRAFALAALRANIPSTDNDCAPFAEALDLRLGTEPDAHVFLGDEDVTLELHNPEIEEHVSSYARLPAVRAVMRASQRAFAARGHTVLAGRDIGEIVLPDAPLKFYLDADEDSRAARRNAERRIEHHEEATRSVQALSRRDRLDSNQTHIPADAVIIDTTHLTLDEVIVKALEQLECAAS